MEDLKKGSVPFSYTDPDSLLAAILEQFGWLFARSAVEVGSNVATAGAISVELDYNLNPSLQKGYGVQLNNKFGDTSYLIQAGIPVTRPIGLYYSVVNAGFEARNGNYNPAVSTAVGFYTSRKTGSALIGIGADYTTKEIISDE